MNKRVMIVEDDSSTRQLLAEIVRTVDSEAEIREFPSMEGIYETAMTVHFDLFLLDIILKQGSQADMSGIRFADKIRTVEEYEFTPIIFVTSLEDAKLYAYSKLHSFGYIEKPFDVEEVKKVISSALRYLKANRSDNSLFLRKNGIWYPIKCSEIVYFESARRKIRFYKSNGEVIIIYYKTLKQILDEAACEYLLQCSRNIVINTEYVENVDIVNRCIKMKGIDEPVNIGITFLKKVFNEFGNN